MPLPMFGLGGLGKFLTGVATHEVIRNGAKKAVDILGKRVDVLITTDPRADVLEIIRRIDGRDPALARRINERLAEAASAGVENLVVIALGSYIPRDEQAQVRWDEAIERFEWLAGKDPAEFKQHVETLKHDPVAQFIRHWILGNLAVAWSFIDGAAERLADEIKPYADERAARAAQKPTWRTLWLDL